MDLDDAPRAQAGAAPTRPAAASLLDDTRLERVRATTAAGASALYRGVLPRSWNAHVYPFGGVASAIALRAMREELGRPEHAPRTLTTLFASPVADGEIEAEVEVVRAGRGMSQLRATLRNVGSDEPGHVSMAVFGGARRGFSFTDVRPPDWVAPQDAAPPKEPPAEHARFRSPFFEQLEVRQWNVRSSWETGWEPGRARASRWMRYRVPPLREDGVLDPLAYVPVCDTMPPSVVQAVGPGGPTFFAPSCDLTVQIFRETRSEWLLADARTHWAGDGYASSTIDLWDVDRQLLARASQLMYLRLDAEA